MKVMMMHETTPSPTTQLQASFEPSLLPYSSDKPLELILFAHPHCVCTKATLAELKWILSKCADSLHATIFFVKPDGATEEWTKSENWKLAQTIDGARIEIDEAAQLAKQLGALSSGQTFVCDRNGQLLFSGGITGARGVEGDNRGRQAILSLASNLHSDTLLTTDVFGCSLY